MKRIFTHLFVTVLLMLSATSWAQLSSLEVGQIYRFKSARADRSLAADGTDDVHVKATDVNDKKQEWYVTKDGDYYVLRNVACGKYLKGAKTYYVDWAMTDDYSATENKFQLRVSNSTLNTLKTKDSNDYGHMHDSNNGDNGGYNVVGWLNGNDNTGSHWTITKVNYTSEQIKALLDAAPTIAEAAAYGDALAAIFADAACTELKNSYAAMSVEQIKADANYIALPATLQKTILKIKNDSWGEDNADATKQANNLNWDDKYAKKFRVQMYEPYSIAGDITSWLGINAHANNDNPTGIYMPAAGTLYVMVEGEIKTGATLRLVNAGSNDRITKAATDGIALQPGLNVINYTGSTGMLYICYNVDTYNPNGADDAAKFPHKLSDFAPLKIHIEGGAINGFYNACGDFRAATDAENLWKTYTRASVDADTDWEYMETRANLSVLPILGHRQILLFSLGETEGNNGMAHYLPDNITVPQTPYSSTNKWSDYGMGCDPSTGKINIMVEAWDRIMYSELATMGLVSESDMANMNQFYPRWTKEGTRAEIYDYSGASRVDGLTLEQFCGVDYSEVFNHHGVALGVGGDSYMYGGGDHCGYNHNTMNGVIQTIASNAGSTWGPGHEIGHQHQALLTLNGLMEVTNNLFANVALWYKGMSTSRYNGNEGSLEKVLAAFNTYGGDTYTNNIWALTHMYYRLWLYYHLAGNNTQFYPRLFELLRHNPMNRQYLQAGDVSMMHFYKLACQAAGEDLTEFFRAHGYFSVMDNRLVGDYSNSVYTLTQKMIDDAIAEVKAMNLKENLSIIFINDDDEKANYLQHDGTSKRVIYGETSPNSDFGSVSDFIAGNEATTPYTATLNSDGIVTMSGGTGGVGFLVLNEKGEIVSFSNKSTFALGDEAMIAIVSGKAKIVSVSSDNDIAPVEADVDLSAIKKEVLGILIADVEAVVANVDDTFTKVGYYKPAAVVDLKTLLDAAKDVYANSSAYEGAYEMLYTEYRNVIDNPNSLVGVISGKKYAIKSKSGNDYMTVSEPNVITTGNSTFPTTDANLWIIETSGENYRIKHAGTGKYLQGVSDANSVRYTVGSTAVDYKMTRVENGYYVLSTAEHPTRYMNRHNSSNVATWNGTDGNSQWTITLVETVQDVEAIANFELLLSKTRSLLDKVADVDYTGDAYPLQADDSSSDFFITSNATEGGHEPKYLLDNTTASFFHTVWTGSSPGEAHYLQIDLGEGNEIDQFVFSYSTIGQTNVDAPEVIEITGSDSPNSGFQTIATLSGSLPTTHLTPYTSDVLGSAGTKYRYLRFTVTDATGGTLGGYHYFGISELAIKRIDYKFNNLRNGYESINNSVVTATIEQYEAVKQVVANGSGYADALTELQTAYNNLLTEYNNALATYKRTLEELIGATELLIVDAGTVEFGISTSLKLTTDNLYCNAPYTASNNDDYSAAYVGKLTDGSKTTYLHTDYSGSIAVPHYLRVYLGNGSTTTKFKFNYSTRDNGNNCPTTIVVEGCNEADGTYNAIKTFTTTDGLPNPGQNTGGGVAADFESSVITMSEAYRYVRFRVTGVEGGGANYFVMSEFGFSTVVDNVSVKDNYAAVVSEDLLLSTYFVNEASKAMCESAVGLSVELLKSQIADQQAAKAALEEAMAKMAVDKDALQSLYDEALALYGKMSNDEGNVYYAPSALTDDMLAAARVALDAAKDKLDNSNSQSEIDAAKDALQTQYDALLEIENADVTDRDALTTLIGNANTLLDDIAEKGEGYYSTADLALDNLRNALQSAEQEIGGYLIAERYGDLLTQLQDAYDTTNTAVGFDVNDRDALTTLISNVKLLLADIAVAGEKSAYALPLQTTDANGNFYIKLSRVGSGNIANIIDKKSDGSANTGTYVGSAWGGTIADYTHYVQVDLGADCSLDELSFDYATRSDGNYSTERPTAIKVLGSNDGNEFTEVTTLTEGLATGAGEHSALLSVELGKHYRYVRFAVKSGVNSFHMSDFNLYVVLDYTLKEYYTNAEGLGFVELCMALLSAENAAAHYMTSDKFDKVKTMLDGYYTTTQDVVDLDYKERGELETLIDDTQALIAAVATVTEVETPTLSTANVYCNADNSTNANADNGDKLGVSALFDGKVNTHLHTTFGNHQQDDDLDHYIRVDMGEGKAVQNFSFNYIGRSSSSNNDPKEIVVQACNTVDGNWVTVKTLTGLPTEGDAVEYTSPVIEMNEPYRFVRLMVTDTENHKTTSYNDISHKFFVMSEFGFTAYPTVVVKEEYQNVTSHTVLDAYMEKNSAAEANGYYMLAADYTETLAGLQAAYNALNHEKELCSLPVKLTTDVNNPVLYKIKVKSNEKVFTYDGQSGDASKNPILSVDALGNKYQAWYFMQGNNEDSNDDILILPYYHEGALNTTHKLGYPNINGSTKPVVSESDASSYNWYITFTENKTTEGWWNLQPQGGTSDNTFVNQQGGSSSTILSFWKSTNNPGDNGSQFCFVLDETDYSLSDAYFALYEAWAAADTDVAYGTKIGTYTQESVTAYNTAYNNAAALLEAKNSTDEVYNDARTELATKYNAIEYNRGLCRIRSAFRDANGNDTYCSGNLVYVNTVDNKLKFEPATDENLSKYVWEFVPVEGGYNIKSLHTQSNVVSATTWGGQVALSDEGVAKLVTIDFLAEDIVRLNVSGGHPLHAQDQGSTIVHYPGGLESASAWYVEKIEDVTTIKHTVTMNATFSSVMLGYNATVPAGVEAYNAEGVEDGYVTLVELAREREVIPANTPVILYRTDNNTSKTFTYTTADATNTPDETVLGGSLYQKFVECDDDKDYYKLMIKGGEAKMYWMYKEFTAEGESLGETNDGGYIKCSANKIYMALPQREQAASFGMRFVSGDGTTTEVIDFAGEQNADTIYDLQGRKLTEITQPGFYIVNGKKVYVK